MSNRYHVAGSQGACEPGSGETVLANKLGISDSADMEEAELVLLEKLYEAVLYDDFPDRRLHIADLKNWHRLWLGNVYEWAGQERAVNMSKGDFHFAAAAQVPRLLTAFEKQCLVLHTPCRTTDDDDIAQAIAITHVEFILIHPFREGNGRLSRLLADVMAVQAGREPLDYSAWDAGKARYFSAIQRGMEMDYVEMKALVKLALTS